MRRAATLLFTLLRLALATPLSGQGTLALAAGPTEGEPAALAAGVAADLEASWTPEAVTDFLDTLGRPQ